jgi:hypothetical protein
MPPTTALINAMTAADGPVFGIEDAVPVVAVCGAGVVAGCEVLSVVAVLLSVEDVLGAGVAACEGVLVVGDLFVADFSFV